MRINTAVLSIVLTLLFCVSLLSGIHRRAAAHTALSAAQAITPQPEKKFVLQVGIDAYEHLTRLSGCVHDVTDMRNLLISRFGFQPEQFKTLTNEQATHEAIISAFKDHLIENAKKNPNARIIFQYSGHGSQVKDGNEDEGDEMDETLVTVNSRDPKGKNFDILDDELDELFNELSRYTPNIVFILDSCHSGTGTRGSDGVRMVEADKRPQPKQRPLTKATSGSRSTDSPEIPFLPAERKYVALAGSRAEEKSNEKTLIEGKQSNGAMTFYLLEELRKATPETTYRDLMGRVAAKVSADFPSQHPQVEGDIDRPVLGGAAVRTDYYIRLHNVDGPNITISAGAAQGLLPGTVLALYAPDAKKLSGLEKRLATATVKSVEALTAQAEVQGNVTIPKEAKVVVMSPEFGSLRLRVALDPMTGRGVDDPARKMLSDLKASLTNKVNQEMTTKGVKWVDVVDGTQASAGGARSVRAWDVAVFHDKFKIVFPNPANVAPSADQKNAALPANDTDVWYVAGADKEPLYGFFVIATDPKAAEKLENVLVHIAYQRVLRSLNNEATSLDKCIKITPVRVVPIKDQSGKITGFDKSQEKVMERPPAGQTAFPFDQGEYFTLEIENLSTTDLFVTIFDLSTDGSISIVHPLNKTGEILKNGVKTRSKSIFRVTGPSGLETYKAMATTTPTGPNDFEFLTLPAIRRGTETITTVSFTDWTTSEITFKISGNKR